MFFPHARGMFFLVALAFMAGTLKAEDETAGPSAALTSAQIVERMQHFNQVRAAGLSRYESVRHYKVEYRGFAKTIVGAMEVKVDYDASSGKSLRIVSESGSKFLCERVLKRAVESEREAFQDRGATALTPANYRFKLAGSESVGGRPAYLLDVEPLTSSKFLYRGKVWVDAADFAVVKMETEPAKSPSFWISRTLIHYTSLKTDGFWFPEKMQSETKVRIGGTAVMTIDYGNYRVEPSGGS